MRKLIVVLLFMCLVSAEASARDWRELRVVRCARELVTRAQNWIQKLRRPEAAPAQVGADVEPGIEPALRAYALDRAWLDRVYSEGSPLGLVVNGDAVPAGIDPIVDGYLRLEAYGREPVVSDRYLPGLALLLAGRARALFDVGEVFDLSAWQRGLSPALGLNLRPPRLISPASDTVKWPAVEVPKVNFEHPDVAEYAVKWRDLEAETQLAAQKIRVSVFGSSSGNAQVNEQSRALGRLLATDGFAVVTGGAGGVMKATNVGAREVGGISIGIPIRPGMVDLPRERVPAMDYHTLTLAVSDYSTRIPLLLSSGAIVFMPGTEGTMRELGAALLKYERAEMPLVFVGVKYWGPVVDAIRRVLPEGRNPQWVAAVESPEAAADLVRRFFTTPIAGD